MIIYELHDDTMRQLLVPRTAKNSAGVKSGANFFRIYSIRRIEDEYEVSCDETSYSLYGIDI